MSRKKGGKKTKERGGEINGDKIKAWILNFFGCNFSCLQVGSSNSATRTT
jgi:hypothetical protein